MQTIRSCSNWRTYQMLCMKEKLYNCETNDKPRRRRVTIHRDVNESFAIFNSLEYVCYGRLRVNDVEAKTRIVFIIAPCI